MSKQRRAQQARRARRQRASHVHLALVPWSRPELAVSAGAAAIAAVLQLATLSHHASFADGTEYIAGVRVLGNLHPPGYPTYVIAARLFTLLLPGVDFTLRVNLFSIVCLAAATTVVQRLGRIAGAGRWPSLFGAAVFASGTSTWFYGGYAKHYALASLLTAAGLLFLARWRVTGARRDMIVAGVAAGLLSGAGWPFAVVLVLAGIAVVWTARQREPAKVALLGLSAAALVAVALLAFVAVRAAQAPALNWGDPDSLGRIYDVLTFKDFGVAGRALGGSQSTATVGTPFKRVVAYGVMSTREVGLAALAFAAVGVASLRRRRALDVGALLGGALLGELVLAVIVVGPTHVRGFDTLLYQGGYLHGVWEAAAVLAALGLGEAVAWMRQTAARDLVVTSAAIAAAAIVLVPSVIVHGAQMDRRSTDITPRYATMVLDALPRRAVLFVQGKERAMPLWYDQLVEHHRRDVVVVASDGLTSDWYHDEVEKELGALPARQYATVANAVAVAQAVSRSRPVYFEPFAAELVHQSVGYRFTGYLAELVPDTTGAQPIEDMPAAARRLGAITDLFLALDKPTEFPNRYMDQSVARAHIEMARDFTNRNKLQQAAGELRIALRLDPGYDIALKNLQLIQTQLAG